MKFEGLSDEVPKQQGKGLGGSVSACSMTAAVMQVRDFLVEGRADGGNGVANRRQHGRKMSRCVVCGPWATGSPDAGEDNETTRSLTPCLKQRGRQAPKHSLTLQYSSTGWRCSKDCRIRRMAVAISGPAESRMALYTSDRPSSFALLF